MKETGSLFAGEDLQMANVYTQSFTPSNPPWSVPHSTSEQQTKTKTRDNPESMCHRGLSGSAGWNAECRSSLEMRRQFLIKLNVCLPRPAATALLGVYPRDWKLGPHKWWWTSIVALCAVTPFRKGPSTLSRTLGEQTVLPHKGTATAQNKL